MRKPQILYLSYTGLLEPLGQSQILAYLKKLSYHYEFTVISFEKPDDLLNTDKVNELKAICKEYNINWIPKRYHRSPRFLATFFDLLQMFVASFLVIKERRVNIIHCRSYIPTMVACLFKLPTVKIVFDMRALWIEEMIGAGRLRKGSLLHWLLVYIERLLLKSSHHIVSLTQSAVNYLVAEKNVNHTKFSVITTCVDVDKFRLETNLYQKLGTMGTVDSGWYKLEYMFEFLQQQMYLDSTSRFKIVTRDDPFLLYQEAEKYQIPMDSLDIVKSEPLEVAKNINDLKAGLLFFSGGLSKLGSAPTRLGEFLACGIPVLVNDIGDMASIVEKYNVGIVVHDEGSESIMQSLISLEELLKDPDLPKRCRYAAEDYFSVEKGSKKYHDIYQKLLVSS